MNCTAPDETQRIYTVRVGRGSSTDTEAVIPTYPTPGPRTRLSVTSHHGSACCRANHS